MISAAEFNQRITLQSKSVTRNSIGEEVVTWGDVADGLGKSHAPTRQCVSMPLKQQQHVIDARFLIRQRTGLTEDMRLQWKGEPYDITSIIKGTGPYTGTLELAAINGVRDGR
jgi:SPP1 family predicted phage head-tail adaptor